MRKPALTTLCVQRGTSSPSGGSRNMPRARMMSGKKIQRGNCYATSEALYHLLGGKRAGWTPQYMNTRATGNHWFLKHKTGLIIDPTRKQFARGVKVNYD